MKTQAPSEGGGAAAPEYMTRLYGEASAPTWEVFDELALGFMDEATQSKAPGAVPWLRHQAGRALGV